MVWTFDNLQSVKEWKDHDIYDIGVSTTRMVTRSQGCFNVIRNTQSDLDIFANANRQQPPNMPHVMVVMKGGYGAIPNTYITRSFDKYLNIDEALCKDLDKFKSYKPETIQPKAKKRKRSRKM
ncbi:uncharacterized protein TNIN_312231 [Trichonephila inaurata madagascariensis]|uniref:Uncharacterized protein n=1 Tax=Trichonephila inaurata madagascariensis TaxID=2747483 RepID=A0A8X6IHB6_9ARAC|nr:uncharacterized protein TNIN_312231 [Trichonephila inaurata madagascariensis]